MAVSFARTNAAAAKTIGEVIRKACDADACTGVVTGCYRLPGTPNFPDAKKLARGRTVVPTQLIRVTDKVWTVEEPSALLFHRLQIRS